MDARVELTLCLGNCKDYVFLHCFCPAASKNPVASVECILTFPLQKGKPGHKTERRGTLSQIISGCLIFHNHFN